MGKGGSIIFACEKGFTLLEMMASLSLLMVLCTLVFPQVILLMREEKNTQIRHEAHVLLKEQISSYYMDSAYSQTFTSAVAGTVYEVLWTDVQERNEKRVCMMWNDMNQQRQERCVHVRGKE
nr:competence type IV pilus minor pilin ComGE [Ectobacillus panaciterrae]